MTDPSAFLEEPYEIDSVTPTDTPDGMEGDDWRCYVIVQGSNSIRGFRQGSQREVTRAVEEIVIQLNDRRFGKRAKAKRAAAS